MPRPEITPGLISRIHDAALRETGGTAGILDHGTLEHIVSKAEAEADPVVRASIYLHDIVKLHPFFDGNKRTAVNVCFLVLDEAGLVPEASTTEWVSLVLALAQYRRTVRGVARWLRARVRRRRV